MAAKILQTDGLVSIVRAVNTRSLTIQSDLEIRISVRNHHAVCKRVIVEHGNVGLDSNLLVRPRLVKYVPTGKSKKKTQKKLSSATRSVLCPVTLTHMTY